MAVLLTCHEIKKSYSSRPLFDHLSMTLSEGDRLGIIGPNGSGKSTLVQILAGLNEPDGGTFSIRKGTRVAYVPQDSVFDAGLTVEGILRQAIPNATPEEADAQVNVTLGRVGFIDGDVQAAALSGGWKKRLAIARELIRQPDVLLLDEPTNHLDLEGILWLEKLLIGSRFACLVVSHDRYFLENVALQMCEINRTYPDGLFYVQGNYGTFLERKADFLHAQSQQQEALENIVRREVEWLRRGPKARTTKSKARISAAGRLKEELADVSSRNATATSQIDFVASDRKTKKLIALEDVAKSMGGRKLFSGLNLKLGPGMRLGLVGANGSGKTTLLKILNGTLEADSGLVERADVLHVITFDQHREQLDPQLTLRRALCPEGDSVIYRDRTVHVIGWAKRFLFRADQLEQPVGSLSGGERARVLIARLMLRSADVLLLDEPTNDLDIPTLEILEESLLEFPGALVLVTHDRYMLDRVSTVVLGLNGESGTLFADYSQWEQAQTVRKQKPAKVAAPTPEKAPTPKKKLSYREQTEWEGMEAKIVEAEATLESRRREFEQAGSSGKGELIDESYRAMQGAKSEVEKLYARWAELEVKLAQ